LDEREAFLSLVGGFLDGIESSAFPADLERIEIVELNSKRAERLKRTLSEFIAPRLRSDPQASNQHVQTFSFGATTHDSFSSFGVQSERKALRRHDPRTYQKGRVILRRCVRVKFGIKVNAHGLIRG
jgi:hypothetical protein